MKLHSNLSLALSLVLPAVLAAQGAPTQSAAPVPGPPVRVLGAAIATTVEQLGLTPTQMQVRGLPGGRVLLNDGTRRRLLLLDSNMRLIKVVVDSMPVVGAAYGINPGKLLPYRADSSLLMDAGTLSMLVIDGDGNVVKVRAIPRADHVSYLASAGLGSAYGNPGFDGQGRLIYRIADPSAPLSLALGGGVMVPTQPDSAPVLRMNLETRKLDTAARVKIQKRTTVATQTPTGGISMRTTTNPMPVQDDWAVTSDGSVALLRHRDYSIDWLRPDGRLESSPPMPFDWQRLTDDHKKAFVDSIRTQLEASRQRTMARYDSINHVCFNAERLMGPPIAKEIRDSMQAASARANAEIARGGRGAAGSRAGGRGAAAPLPPAGRAATPPPAVRPTTTATTQTGAAADGRGVAVPPGVPTSPIVQPPMPSCPPTPPPPQLMNPAAPTVIAYNELPDYKPPFPASSMRADEDGNLWIRINQMRPVANTILYDIANNKGELINRIQTSTARTLAGFGPGNIVYMFVRQPTGLKLERVRWK